MALTHLRRTRKELREVLNKRVAFQIIQQILLAKAHLQLERFLKEVVLEKSKVFKLFHVIAFIDIVLV